MSFRDTYAALGGRAAGGLIQNLQEHRRVDTCTSQSVQIVALAVGQDVMRLEMRRNPPWSLCKSPDPGLRLRVRMPALVVGLCPSKQYHYVTSKPALLRRLELWLRANRGLLPAGLSHL